MKKFRYRIRPKQHQRKGRELIEWLYENGFSRQAGETVWATTDGCTAWIDKDSTGPYLTVNDPTL